MKFNYLAVFGCLPILALLVQAHQQDQYPPTGFNNSNINHGSTPASLLSLLLSPIHFTITRAARFLGIDNAKDKIDLIKLKTYEAFMSLYNKTYSPDEIPRRMALFFRRQKEIAESEKMYREGKSTYAMSENAFIDWDDNELKMLTGISIPNEQELSTELPINSVRNSLMIEDINEFNWTVKAGTLPATKDWRIGGCVLKPRAQSSCGSCYAMATMNVLESMQCIKRGWKSAWELSPQQIVDCSNRTFGCNGGWPDIVLEYLQDVGKIAHEDMYPYVKAQGTCKFNELKSRAFYVSPTYKMKLEYKTLNNERDILYHVANTGPVVTVIQATDKFLYFGRGIFDDERCIRAYINHAISIVGYGRENGIDYWLIKNSWGTDWGEDGFGKVRRGSLTCSIGSWGWVITA